MDLRALTADEFAYQKPTDRGIEKLDAICDDVQNLPDPSAVFPEFFHLMERLSDSELGSPGSLVHTMERFTGAYEDLLIASVSRKPTPLTVWMVNRILNGKTEDKAKWMKILTFAIDHPGASDVTRDQARHFVAFQQKK